MAKAATAEAPAEATPEAPAGFTTKQVAEQLNLTPVHLRRILRSMDQFNDKTYTRYNLSQEQVDAIKAAVAAQASTPRKPRGKKAAATENSAEEVAGELSTLEDGDSDVETLDLEDDSDES